MAVVFPNPNKALPSGLLAVGGELSPELIIEAYSHGIFPWYSEGEPVMWFHPDPRFVLYPDELIISDSMKRLMKKTTWEIKMNTAFETVMQNCASIKRKDQEGTWITKDMKKVYAQLNKHGIALSVETWDGDKLIGGFYGIRMGKIFFGESMFAQVSNASKYAFIHFVQQFKSYLTLIDCQSHTNHLESLGARMISRKAFMKELKMGGI